MSSRSYCDSTDDAYNSNNAILGNPINLVCSVALGLWSSLLAPVEWFWDLLISYKCEDVSKLERQTYTDRQLYM